MTADEPPTVEAPDLIEPVIGFRQWRLADDGLLSVAFDHRWTQPTLVARCLMDSHPQEDSPVSACSCGVHAWYEPCSRIESAPTRNYVAGAVVMWGAIELHGSGMRAQYCRIVALALPLSRWRKRRRVLDIAGRLGVPAVRHRDLLTVARRHGVRVAPELRPSVDPIGSAQGPGGLVARTGTRRPLP
jgi:hypothetical protein